MEEVPESPSLQYGAWLRREVPRRGGDESIKPEPEDRWYEKGGLAKGMRGGRGMFVHAPGMRLVNEKISESSLPQQGDSGRGEETTVEGLKSQKQRSDHEKGKATSFREHPQEIHANLVKEDKEGLWAQSQTKEEMRWEKETHPEVEVPFNFRVAPKATDGEVEVGLVSVDKETGPMAMSFDVELGWVAEELGPKSGHWKRMARMAHIASPTKELVKNNTLGKRPGPVPVQELETDVTNWKRRKNQEQSNVLEHSEERDGEEAVAAEQPRRAS